MNRKFLVSEIFDNALAKYIENEKKGTLQQSSDNYINIIKCLVFIYGDLDLINPNITKDSRALIENMAKYGYSKNDIHDFFNYFDSYDLFNISKNLIDMFKCKQILLNLDENSELEFKILLQNIINIEEIEVLFSYYVEKTNPKDEIEYLEVEPIYKEEKEKKDSLSFQLDAVNGFVSIMSILIFIAIICIGIVVINIIVG